MAGGLGDRWGRRPLMVGGAGVFAVSVLGYGLVPGPAGLAGLRLLTGAGEAGFFMACWPPWPTWPRPSAGARR